MLITEFGRRKFRMGICWSWITGKSKEAPAPTAQAPASTSQAPAPEPIPDPDPATSPVGHLLNGDISLLDSNASGNSWFSMATTNITTWMSQASGAIAAIWGNNVPNDNEFTVAVDDDALPDLGTHTDHSKLRAFTFEQLKAATFNFRSDMFVGKGGFGSVYKGWLKEKLPSQGIRKRAIAIKKLDSSSKQGIRQWRTEVGFLARLSHPNIVKLLGYCRENEKLVIVYEFMEKGSLNYHLFRKGSAHLLAWETRLKIAIEMAQGLSYLHMMDKPIIYRDLKSSNVLLDGFYNAKISDFGLAKWGPTDGNSCVTGHVVGTTGYAAPEYVATGSLWVKSDVYSFGVVLVEMLTGLRAFDARRPSGQQSLVEWVRPILSNRRKLRGVMDSRLEGKYATKQVSLVALLAVRCLDPNPETRPSMKEVAEKLEKMKR